MSVTITSYTTGRRFLRRAAQTRVLESILAGLKRPAIRRAMRQRCRDGETCTVFRDIEIETINRCNGTCSFCPVNVHDDSRPLAKMEDAVFTGIVRELASMQYEGSIGLSSNNEPFMDKRIVQRIAECRTACPKARLYLYTNGTLLDAEKVLLSVRAGLDKMVIDDYSDELSLSANVRQIVAALDRPENAWAAAKVEVAIRKRNEVLRNRAGRAPNKPNADYRAFALFSGAGCTNPFKQIVIRPTGLVSLCCNDTLGEITLGDAGRQGLLAVWNGPEFRGVRRRLLADGRRNLELCSCCDISCLGLSETIRLLLRRA